MLMKNAALLFLFLCSVTYGFAQDVQIDGRLQPLLNEFFAKCDHYNIEYHDKLFKLESIDIVNTLPVSENSSILGMLRRNDAGEVVAIDINWLAQIDPEILKVVAFHEFAHYFLEYSSHICDDCEHVMAVVNTSYYDIIEDWDAQVALLFQDAPAYQKQSNTTVAVGQLKKP